ncbi:ATP-binding protein [Streptomyces sp. NRRL F-2295]|uniref:ATP-binding protein n=1 Tax=Streptomyces sp. NRRL F-2295 TaxID=1519477 RepID=UPI00099BD938|nr:ATP-binding protein [Streptomyces sp. NRRL F-2295]
MPPVFAPPVPFPYALPSSCEGYQLAMPNSAFAAKIVRDFVGALLRTGAHAGLADDARLCVSEVVSNVYCHTRSELVRVEVLVGREEVAVHVTNDHTGPLPEPLIRPEGEGGRGLLVVNGLAASWGSSTRKVKARRTKTVWFVLTEPEPESGTEADCRVGAAEPANEMRPDAAQAQAQAQAPTQAPAQAPTQAPAQAPTQAPAQAPTPH